VRKAAAARGGCHGDAGRKDVIASSTGRSLLTAGSNAIWANAGVSGGLVPLAEQTGGTLAGVLRVNLIGPFLGDQIRHASHDQQKSGSIVCTRRWRAEGRRQRPSLRSQQGRRDPAWCKPRPIRCRHRRAHQRGLSRLIETGMTSRSSTMPRSAGTDHKIGQLNPLKRAGQRMNWRQWDIPRQR